MTTNTWPDPARPGMPLNPERDGWHWVKIIHGISQPRPRLWWSKIDRWELSDGALISPSEFAERWRYLGPVLTPDEAAALQARVAELEEKLDAAGRVLHKAGEQFSEYATQFAAHKTAVSDLKAAANKQWAERCFSAYWLAAEGGKDE